MREIKFRAWDKENNEYLDDVSLQCSSFSWGEILTSYELEQFTGLLDKNGKEIYEGDIIAHYRRSHPYPQKSRHAKVLVIITWNEGKFNDGKDGMSNPGFSHRVVKANDREKFWGYDCSVFYNCEVIGNIHENHNLLEAL